MTWRSRNRGEYWRRLAFVFLLGLAGYAIGISESGGGDTFKVWRPERMRFALIVLVVVAAAAYEWRPQAPRSEPAAPLAESEAMPTPTEVAAETGCHSEVASSSPSMPRTAQPEPVSEQLVQPAKPLMASEPADRSRSTSGTGEAEYAQARQIPHQLVPDYSQANDSEYLELLGQSAACGYPPALAKLGEYAVRRAAWVEAYYWTWQARRAGMPDLEIALRSIRLSWATEGYRSQSENVHRLFSAADGSVGRALLNLDSGRDVQAAKAYLRANRPEFGV